MPYSIFRSMTSDPTSIAAIPARSPSVRTRARLRLIRRVEPLSGTSANDHTQAPFLRARRKRPLGIQDLDPHPGVVRAHRQHVTDLEVLELGTIFSALCISSPSRRSIQSYVYAPPRPTPICTSHGQIAAGGRRS
jgi:hypothetical protein